jgi:type IV pilus assembly protein PilC
VKNGNQFSQALSAYPKIFNRVFIGLVAAGEKTGNMADSFEHISEHLKWSAEIRRKVKKATRYPMVLLVVITLVISVLMIFVVPKLVSFIVSQGFSLPIHTRALIATSDAFEHYWYIILGVPVTLIAGTLIMYRVSSSFAYSMDAFILRLPVLGSTVRKIDMARFTHFFAVMFRSGIEILEALKAAKEVVNNRVLKESVDFVRTSVMEGNTLTSSLRLSNQFPNLVIRMFKVGEDSGNMNDALENINFFYTREVNDAVDGMVGMVQPTLTVIMGVLIFWIISSVFGPLYESFSKMKF